MVVLVPLGGLGFALVAVRRRLGGGASLAAEVFGRFSPRFGLGVLTPLTMSTVTLGTFIFFPRVVMLSVPLLPFPRPLGLLRIVGTPGGRVVPAPPAAPRRPGVPPAVSVSPAFVRLASRGPVLLVGTHHLRNEPAGLLHPPQRLALLRKRDSTVRLNDSLFRVVHLQRSVSEYSSVHLNSLRYRGRVRELQEGKSRRLRLIPCHSHKLYLPAPHEELHNLLGRGLVCQIPNIDSPTDLILYYGVVLRACGRVLSRDVFVVLGTHQLGVAYLSLRGDILEAGVSHRQGPVYEHGVGEAGGETRLLGGGVADAAGATGHHGGLLFRVQVDLFDVSEDREEGLHLQSGARGRYVRDLNDTTAVGVYFT